MFRGYRVALVPIVLVVSQLSLVSVGRAQPAITTLAPSPLPVQITSEAQPLSDPLLDQVDEAIRVNGQRFLTANYHSPWQIFHGILAYRREFQLKVGDQKMSAIDWVATADPRFDGRPLILVTQHGAKFHPFTRPWAFEGHAGQTLALLSESRLPVDFKLQASGREVTIGEMLQNVMMEANTREETTWVLWALINYFKVDAQWTNQWGEAWSIEALVRNEVNAHTPTRPCGGNHNLFVLCRARDKYLATGRPLRGVWFEADQKIRQYVEFARSLQNPDGSFSSNFYKGPGHSQDMNTRFNTTGHTMEFLSVGLPQERLNEPWVRNAVHVLSQELITHRKAPVDCGPLYHSINGLMIYRDRLRPPQTITVAKPAIEDATPTRDAPATPGVTPEKPTSVPSTPAPSPATTPAPSASQPTSPTPSTSTPTPATLPATPSPSAVDPTAPQLPVESNASLVRPVSALETQNR